MAVLIVLWGGFYQRPLLKAGCRQSRPEVGKRAKKMMQNEFLPGDYEKTEKILAFSRKHRIMRPSDSAPVAQLDRVLGYEPRGRAFESLRARQSMTKSGTSFEVPFLLACGGYHPWLLRASHPRYALVIIAFSLAGRRKQCDGIPGLR